MNSLLTYLLASTFTPQQRCPRFAVSSRRNPPLGAGVCSGQRGNRAHWPRAEGGIYICMSMCISVSVHVQREFESPSKIKYQVYRQRHNSPHLSHSFRVLLTLWFLCNLKSTSCSVSTSGDRIISILAHATYAIDPYLFITSTTPSHIRIQVLKADLNALASKDFTAGTLPYLGYDAFDDKSGEQDIILPHSVVINAFSYAVWLTQFGFQNLFLTCLSLILVLIIFTWCAVIVFYVRCVTYFSRKRQERRSHFCNGRWNRCKTTGPATVDARGATIVLCLFLLWFFSSICITESCFYFSMLVSVSGILWRQNLAPFRTSCTPKASGILGFAADHVLNYTYTIISK